MQTSAAHIDAKKHMSLYKLLPKMCGVASDRFVYPIRSKSYLPAFLLQAPTNLAESPFVERWFCWLPPQIQMHLGFHWFLNSFGHPWSHVHLGNAGSPWTPSHWPSSSLSHHPLHCTIQTWLLAVELFLKKRWRLLESHVGIFYQVVSIRLMFGDKYFNMCLLNGEYFIFNKSTSFSSLKFEDRILGRFCQSLRGFHP